MSCFYVSLIYRTARAGKQGRFQPHNPKPQTQARNPKPETRDTLAGTQRHTHMEREEGGRGEGESDTHPGFAGTEREGCGGGGEGREGGGARERESVCLTVTEDAQGAASWSSVTLRTPSCATLRSP
jgi:hypothetical protein